MHQPMLQGSFKYMSGLEHQSAITFIQATRSFVSCNDNTRALTLVLHVVVFSKQLCLITTAMLELLIAARAWTRRNVPYRTTSVKCYRFDKHRNKSREGPFMNCGHSLETQYIAKSAKYRSIFSIATTNLRMYPQWYQTRIVRRNTASSTSVHQLMAPSWITSYNIQVKIRCMTGSC